MGFRVQGLGFIEVVNVKALGANSVLAETY